MTEPSSWPPPPDTPHPLAVHDEFLSAYVRNSTPKPPLSRLRLAKDLYQETGLDLRSCLATVNNFCDRHAILMPLGGLWKWAGCLLPFATLATLAAMNITWLVLQRRHDAAATHLERVAITAERINLDFVFLGIIVVASSINLILVFRRLAKNRADAAEAKAKFAR